jgi:hypothetical protein
MNEDLPLIGDSNEYERDYGFDERKLHFEVHLYAHLLTRS